MPRKLVVAGLIARGESFLITQRPPGGPLGLKWEFPGGKIEPGESPEGALIRELEEEIAARVEVGPIWDVLYHRYPDFELLMLIYLCRLEDGENPSCREVEALAWVDSDALEGYEILVADRPLVERIRREGIPPFPTGLRAEGNSN